MMIPPPVIVMLNAVKHLAHDGDLVSEAEVPSVIEHESLSMVARVSMLGRFGFGDEGVFPDLTGEQWSLWRTMATFTAKRPYYVLLHLHRRLDKALYRHGGIIKDASFALGAPAHNNKASGCHVITIYLYRSKA